MMKSRAIVIGLAFILTIALTPSAAAVMPTDEVIEKLKADGRFDAFMERMHQQHLDMISHPEFKNYGHSLSASVKAVDTHNVIVILIDWADKQAQDGYVNTNAQDFDSLLFSEGKNPTGSMREFYKENSYGQYIMKGTVVGWYRADGNYFNYNNQNDPGEFGDLGTSNLIRQACQMADPNVDFTQFDNDNDGAIDGIIVVHAGTGYEETGNELEIHSHSGGVSPTLYLDGVRAERYTIQPEESPSLGGRMNAIGVFCHEWGHVLGQIDFYDTDYSSNGVGTWCLMGAGNYNNNSQSPAHFSALSKAENGWMTLINVDSTMTLTNVEIPAIQFNPVAYRLDKGGRYSNEYFIVENRANLGFDTGLPGHGLMIYHVDEDLHTNTNDWHPRLFIEQADGEFDLQYRRPADAGDVFPGATNNRNFHDKTVPSSRYYQITVASEVAVLNISDADSVMYADFEINFTKPWITGTGVNFSDDAFGDGDGILEAGERIQVSIALLNEWADAEDVTATMTSDDLTLEINEEEATFGTIEQNDMVFNTSSPFEFTIPDPITPVIDSFFFEITANDGSYSSTYAVETDIGKASILIVDGEQLPTDTLEKLMVRPMYEKRMPTDVVRRSNGNIGISTLLQYDVVIWFGGTNGYQLLNVDDMFDMEDYLDDGGNLFITGQGIAERMKALRNSLLSNYFQVEYRDTTFTTHIPILYSMEGPISSGLGKIAFSAGGADVANQTVWNHLFVKPAGIAEWRYHDIGQGEDYAVISHAAEGYKTVFMTFGFESIIDDFSSGYTNRDDIMNNILDFFGQLPTASDDENTIRVLPTRISLKQNYPNPFNPTTLISYTITGGNESRMVQTRLEVFNVLGQKITTLVDKAKAPGTYTVQWDGRDEAGSTVASGIYFYRLSRGDQTESKKMMLLK